MCVGAGKFSLKYTALNIQAIYGCPEKKRKSTKAKLFSVWRGNVQAELAIKFR